MFVLWWFLGLLGLLLLLGACSEFWFSPLLFSHKRFPVDRSHCRQRMQQNFWSYGSPLPSRTAWEQGSNNDIHIFQISVMLSLTLHTYPDLRNQEHHGVAVCNTLK
ncbi:hypothetical protein ACOSP7_013355 [Xanthoceras sorbifolium]